MRIKPDQEGVLCCVRTLLRIDQAPMLSAIQSQRLSPEHDKRFPVEAPAQAGEE